ncbi:MAG TPA: ribonuclease P protein component [Polyangia bacterium]|nr:ribonuclease P protein component [Polyangia bacterium]
MASAAAGPEHGRGFPRARRVSKRREYLAIQGQGRRVSGDCYMLFALRRTNEAGDAGDPRFGFTVSKKVGGAVVRNRVKRWLRESCRHLRGEFPPGRDFVVVARPSAARAGYAPTAAELANLARRLRAHR